MAHQHPPRFLKIVVTPGDAFKPPLTGQGPARSREKFVLVDVRRREFEPTTGPSTWAKGVIRAR
jgi:hypothetical protein